MEFFSNYVFFCLCFISADLCVSNFLYYWLIVSRLAPELIGPDFCLVQWYLIRTGKAAAARKSIHGSELSTYVYCRLYVSYVHDSLVLDVFVVAFSYGFPMESGLLLIPYTFSIKIILNLRPRNYLPWSYVISTGHGYWTSQIVSTKSAIVIAFLLLYYVI